MRRAVIDLLILIAIAIVIALALAIGRTPVRATCMPAPEENTEWYPTNCVGDVSYGVGWASTWAGPGVARNDCLHPWTDCTPIRITYRGRSVDVVPTMFGDLWRGLGPSETGPNGEAPRLVDLDPATREALGIPGPGIWRVTVCPIDQPAVVERVSAGGCPAKMPPPAMPDTGMR